MKKICMVLFLASGFALEGQVVVTDTVHYFANKQYFRTGMPLTGFPYYKAPAATSTLVTYVGNVFENDEAIDIMGMQACIIRQKGSTQYNLSVPVSMYLCNVNPLSGLPVLPPVDSVNIALMLPSDTVPLRQQGTLTQVRRMNGKYAILFRNMSTRSGDTIRLLRTAGMTATSTAAPALKMSDGCGVITYSGQVVKATNFAAIGFGPGTDYEFALAPIVQYTLQASQVKPMDTLCTHQQVNFINTSSSRISSRFYNLIEFRRTWDQNPPFQPTGYPFPADKGGVAWHFTPEDGTNYYLTPGSNILVFQTDSAHKKKSIPSEDSITCFTGNKFKTNLYGMKLQGGAHLFNHDEEFNLYTSFCGKDGVGLNEQLKQGISIYPQPATGKVSLDGVPAGTELKLYNIAGQMVWSGYTASTGELSLEGMAPGLYLLRIGLQDSQPTLRIMKID
jgi:hypothetical protein